MLPEKQRTKEGRIEMNIIHIMADGTSRNSVEGVVIQNEQFYAILEAILEKKVTA